MLVFVAALAIRLVHVWHLSGAPFFAHLLGDSRGYDEWAQRIAAGDWLGRGVFYQAPLYPYWLGIQYAIVGHSLLFVRLAQATGGAFSCVLLSAATRNWMGGRAGFLAGLLLAVYAPAIFFDALIQKSALDGLLLAGLLLALSPTKMSAMPRAAVAGGLLGLLALSRENAIALLPVLVVALWSWYRPRRGPALVAVAFAAVVLAPVGVRNLLVGGEWHLTTSQFGPNFYIGNNAAATGVYMPLEPEHGSFRDERADATRLAEAAWHRRLSPSEVSEYFLGEGIDWIRSAPADWLRLTARKGLVLVNATEAADTEDIATHAEWSTPLAVAAPLFNFGMLAPLAVLGIWVTRRRWRDLWPLYAVAGVLGATVVVFYVMDRYRYPLVPVLVVFASAAVAEGRWFWRTHGWLERAGSISMLAAAIVICHLPLQATRDMQAVTHYNLAVTLSESHLDDQAEAEYRRAIALQPALSGPHANLGALLGARGSLVEAAVECREAVRLSPRSTSAHINLGIVLGSAGRLQESIAELSQAVQLAPQNAEAHYNLAKGLQLAGQNAAAIKHLRETVRLQPDRAEAYNNLGILLCETGRIADGIEHLRTASKLAAGSPEYAANLQHALRLAGQGP